MAGQKILVVGTGAMGCAIAQAVVDKNGGPVWIYGVDQQELTDLKSGYNRRYFQNHRFNNLVITDDLSEAVQDARHIFLAVPSKVLGEVYQKISDLIKVKKTATLVNLAKGFYPGSSQTAHAFLTQKIRQDRVFRGLVSLYGPSFASEIVERKLTFLAAVSSDQKLSREIQALLSNDYLKIFLEKDALGAQVGAIYKNVVAIASGLLAGLGYGLNAQAVVLTQGFWELSVLVKALGGKQKTANGASGLGDLILTASSSQSRNYTFGLKLAHNRRDSSQTVEGLLALKAVEKIARQRKLRLPICKALYGIIYRQRNPQTILDCLESGAAISQSSRKDL